MRKATVALVAAMILLAGCSGGGGTATPTDTEDDGTVESQPSTEEVFSKLNTSSDTELFANATEIEMTLYNGSSGDLGVLIQNDSDSGTEYTRFSTPDGTLELYGTSDYVAQCKTSSGEIQYGEADSNVGSSVGFAAAFTLIGGLSYFGVVDWQAAGTTTVDGETAYVYEADSLNETALNSQENLDLGFQQDEVQSVSAEMVVSFDIQIQSITVEIETPDGTYGSFLRVNYSPVTIQQPDWVDESQAPN